MLKIDLQDCFSIVSAAMIEEVVVSKSVSNRAEN